MDEFTSNFYKFLSAYSDKKYSTATDIGEKLSAATDTLTELNPDSTFVTIQTFLGKCYYRLNKPEKAAETIEKALNRKVKMNQTNDKQYAFLLDNCGLYLLSADKYEEGLKKSSEALTIMNNLPDMAVTVDMQGVCSHIAEGYYYTKQYSDAILYEIKTLNIIEKLNGKHSDEYIDELPYLSKYYRAAGDDKKADQVDSDVDTIRKEYEDGQVDLPDPDARDLTSAEECHKYAYEAYRCADYYLSHTVAADHMDQCLNYIVGWSQASADVEVVFGKTESDLLKKDETKPIAIAYIAGCVKYAIENNDSTFNRDIYNSAFVDMLNFYLGNKEILGKVKSLDKFVDVYNNKGKDELDEMIDKNYPGE